MPATNLKHGYPM